MIATAGQSATRRALPTWFLLTCLLLAPVVAAFAAFLPPSLAVGGMLAFGFVALALWKPGVALLALYGAGMLTPYAPVSLYHVFYREEYLSLWTIRPIARANLVDLGLMVILAALLLRVALRRRWPWLSSFDWLAVALGLLVALAGLRGAADRSQVQKWSYLLFGLRVFAYPFLAYLLTTRLLGREESQVRRFLLSLFGILCFWIAYTALKGFTSGGAVFERGGLRLMVVGYEIYAMLFVTCLFLAYWAGRYWRGTRTLWLAAFPMLMFLIALLSARRWSLIFFALAVPFVLLHFALPRIARFALGLCLVAVVLVTMTSFASPKLLAGLANLAEIMGLHDRQGRSIEGLDVLRAEGRNVLLNLDRYDGWATGLGLGRKWRVLHSHGITRTYAAYGEDLWSEWIYALHLPLGRQLLEFGPFGLIWWLGVFFAGWWRGRRACRAALVLRSEEQLLRRVATDDFCRLSLIGLGPVIFLLYLSPSEPPNGILLGMLAGLASRICDLVEERRKAAARSLPQVEMPACESA